MTSTQHARRVQSSYRLTIWNWVANVNVEPCRRLLKYLLYNPQNPRPDVFTLGEIDLTCLATIVN